MAARCGRGPRHIVRASSARRARPAQSAGTWPCRSCAAPAARRYTFPALIASDRLIERQPEAAAGAVRAIVQTERALTADPSLARRVARPLFPPEEAEFIAELVRRDSPFYQATISEEAVAGVNQCGQDVGLLSGAVPYDQVVATQLMHLWAG